MKPVHIPLLSLFCVGVSACATSSPGRPIPKEAIAAAVEMRRNEYRACYERAFGPEARVQGHPTGVVRIDFKVDVAGTASNTRVTESSFRNGSLEKCLSSVILSTRFPGADAGNHYEVSYPFQFTHRTSQ